MDIQQLIASLSACTNPDASVRKAGEEAVKQVGAAPEGMPTLLRIAMEASIDPAVRQVAAITFKNTAKRDWADRESRPSAISATDKATVRTLLLEALVQAPGTVRVQVEEALKAVISSDFPEQWPNLTSMIQAFLTSSDQNYLSAGLRALRILVRKYEFRDESDRAPLVVTIDATFSPLLSVFQVLLSSQSPSTDLAELLKLCCKIFWSSCYLEIPPILVREEAQFTGWMSCLLALAQRTLPAEGLPADVEARKQWPWWKAKKWVYNIAYRLFSRYGDPKRGGSKGDVTFASRWKAEYSLPFLSAVLNELSAITRGAWIAPRVSNILLQYVAEAINHADTWKVLKPHVLEMIRHAVMPMLAFQEEDAELWAEDPQEYVRKGYDVIEDIYSSKTAAMNVLQTLCSSRKKSQLDGIMAHVVGLLDALGPSARSDTKAVDEARRLDGALLAIGSLSRTLQREPRYRSQLEPMLLTHVVPLFRSPHGHLRSKAAWVAGVYADTHFAQGQGKGDTFFSLLQAEVTALEDPELPVRVDAGVAIRSFLDAIDAEDLATVRPLVPTLLQRFLSISQEVESEELTTSLESVVDRFGQEIAPYAVVVMSTLAQQFWRSVAMQEEEENEEASIAGGGGGEDYVAQSALAGYSILRAMSSVMEAVSDLVHLYAPLEDILFPILDKYTSQDGLDVYEEITQLLTYLTYFSPAISPRLWSLFPRLLHSLDTWAGDYWRDVLLPLDNFISKSPSEFLASQHNLLDATNRTIEKALAVPEQKQDQKQNQNADRSEDSWSDGDMEEEAVECAAELIGVILQNCRGRVDHCLGPYLALITAQLGVEHERETMDAILMAGVNALYYDAAKTLHILGSTGVGAGGNGLQIFMGALAKAISERRKKDPTKMKHFGSKREKKVVALGLISVLGTPTAALPPMVVASLGQLTVAVVQVLLALKAQEERRNATGEGEEEPPRSSWVDDVDKGDDEDEDEDEDVRTRRWKAAQQRDQLGDDEDDDEDEDDWDGSWWSEEEEDCEVVSPLDSISPFVYFAETLHRVQQTDPQVFTALTGSMDDSVRAAVQGMMAFASQT